MLQAASSKQLASLAGSQNIFMVFSLVCSLFHLLLLLLLLLPLPLLLLLMLILMLLLLLHNFLGRIYCRCM